ncbi:MAG TPA: polyphenol oxidase family protein [Gemmatimonadales bacterium]|nr:polyphenol oxidase family protein [Gemmatimonadales bacterium]
MTAGAAGGATATALREREVAGAVPRWELAEWRERYGLVAGITGRGSDPGADGRDFDLSLWTAAPVSEVMSRWRAFRRAEPGFPGLVLAHQVHGAEVRGHGPVDGWLIQEGADGHVTTAAGLLLCVTVADCIPVYLAAPERRGVALLHAGWRGTAAGILARGVERLARAAGCTPADLTMHCGVGICGPCYEVGAEVVTGVGLAADGPGPWHVDLRERLADQAARLGIRDVTTSAWCSAEGRERFHSHRASKGADGRMVAYLGIPRSD